MNSCYQDFLSPTNAYRGKPFWAWNGKLEEKELLRQIHVMKEMGFGGFFMHSRTGLNTEYLGEEWFRLISACTEEADKLGMEPWIYDEDRWPSGSAGGIVTKNPKFRRKYLTLYLSETPYIAENTVALFKGIVNEKVLADGYTQIPLEQAEQMKLEEGEVFLSFCWRTMENQSVFNGYTDLDRLNLEAVQEFIRVTHEQYRKKCGDSFGKIYGVFTDEPTYGPVFSDFGDTGKEQRWSVPWTYDLFEEFQKRFGFDMIPYLPELFLCKDGESIAKIKWQYMELIEELFIERFLKPIQEWAHSNRMLTTGHFVNEDSLVSQTIPLGSMLRCYSYLDHPGMDLLTEGNFIPWAVKVLESAARQNGQKWKLSELYGATGWQMRFQDYKYVGDWQAVLGVNVRCPHLSWYTMEGEAKRDYPGTFLHQATWYKEYYDLETYFARLGYITSLGEPECDTLVLHPIESIWTQIHVEWAQTLDGIDPVVIGLEKKFKQLFHWLSETHIDFDYGDEGVMAERGSVSEDASGWYLQVGNRKYRRVIVSGCLTIRDTTCSLLETFAEKGGEVLFVGSLPEYVSCERSNRCKQLAKKGKRIPFRREALLQYFTEIPSQIRILDMQAGKDLYLQIRHCEKEDFVLLFNKSRKKTLSQVKIQVGEAQVQIWDCFSGERENCQKEKGMITLSFAPGQEYILCLKRESEIGLKEFSLEETFEPTHLLTEVRKYDLDEKNIYVLDKGDLWLEDMQVAENKETLQMDRIVRTKLGIELRGGEMLQPWAVKDAFRVLGKIKLRYRFSMEYIPGTPVYLVLEPMENLEIRLNQKRDVVMETDLFWIDTCFKVYQIKPGILAKGVNTWEFTADYLQTGGLESMYLLGEFGVFKNKEEMVIRELPKKIQIGDLTKQGLPFYSGKITYHFEFPESESKNLLSIRVPEFGGSCILASAGKEEKMIPWTWRGAEWKLTGEEKEIALTVVTFRRNTFGPLHQFPVKQPHTAPGSFRCDDITKYGLFPIGLLKTPQIRIE